MTHPTNSSGEKPDTAETSDRGKASATAETQGKQQSKKSIAVIALLAAVRRETFECGLVLTGTEVKACASVAAS